MISPREIVDPMAIFVGRTWRSVGVRSSFCYQDIDIAISRDREKCPWTETELIQVRTMYLGQYPPPVLEISTDR